MTLNNPIAPERDVARGSPQDSICMIVATRFGSIDEVFAQRTISFPQCWTSLVKIGERPLVKLLLPEPNDQIGVVTPAVCPAGGPAFWSRAFGIREILSATNATKPTITRAASGGST